MTKFLRFGVVAALIMGVTGCATNRGYLNIKVPEVTPAMSNGKQVYIRSITDNRQFQDNPISADIPSLGSGGLKNATAEVKSRAIARKRNGYGKALGDILLDEGQSVEKSVYDVTRNALYSLGYDVVNTPQEARPDAIIMDISVDKFWGWFVPGVWAISLKSEITTTHTITVPRKDNPIVITATARNVCQSGNEANWKKVFRMVMDDFIQKARVEFQGLE
ncbi:MAG: hypothetical protein WC552_01325 [Candidatus Omnitrophota bacterium]